MKTLRDIISRDIKYLDDSLLALLNAEIQREAARRKKDGFRLENELAEAFPGIPSDKPFQALVSEYLDLLLAQDWSPHFVGGDCERKYYVYAHCHVEGKPFECVTRLLDFRAKGFPFYIGKGCGNRAYDLKRNQGHGAVLKQKLDQGWQSSDIVVIVKEGLTESEALELESKLIYFFGTKYEHGRRGLLVNLDIPSRPNFVSFKKWTKAQAKKKTGSM